MSYALVIFIRLLVPITILRSPWWGLLAALSLDIIDLEVIRLGGYLLDPNFSIDYSRYQSQDKLLDLYMYTFAIYVARLWPEKMAFHTALVLFIYRAVGVILFEIFQTRWLLFFFPNILEFFYIFYVVAIRYWPEFRIKTKKRLTIVLVMVTLPKLQQEYFLHVMGAHAWAYFKHNIVGWPK